MAFKKRSYKRTTKRRPTKRVYKKRMSARKASVRRTVKQVLSRVSETKTAQRFNYGLNLAPSNAATFTAKILELGPGATMPIAQGTGQGGRIGNKITVVSHRFKGYLTCAPQDPTLWPNPRPIHVKMWIFYDKTDPTAAPNPITYPFFQDGNTAAGFQNDLVDHWRPINTDRYRVLATRTFKLGMSQYAGAAATVANQSAWQAYSNNDYKLTCGFNVDLGKLGARVVRFNDTNNEPTSRRLFCMFQPVEATGGILNATWEPCAVQFMEDFRYKDM